MSLGMSHIIVDMSHTNVYMSIVYPNGWLSENQPNHIFLEQFHMVGCLVGSGWVGKGSKDREKVPLAMKAKSTQPLPTKWGKTLEIIEERCGWVGVTDNQPLPTKRLKT